MVHRLMRRHLSLIHILVHEDDEVEEELSTIVDAGGHVKDVFVYHKVYGAVSYTHLHPVFL